jgi:hypothetical protein
MSMTVRVYEVVRFDAGQRCDLNVVERSGLVEGRTAKCSECGDVRGAERWAVICDDGDIRLSCSACLSLTLERTGV